MSVSIDPVDSPAAYQQYLLSALGDDDPAVAQAEAITEVESLVAEAGDLLRVRPEPGEWSVMECIGHILDGELVASGRYRWIVAHDEPAIAGYDQDLWVTRLHHDDADRALQIALYAALRRSNLELWARLSHEDRARIGHHSERGPESYELTFRLIAGHDRIHLAQARRALEAVRAC